MKIYATSKNSGPTWSGRDPISLVYLGTSLNDAENSVGDFAKYETAKKDFPINIHITALPISIQTKLIDYYAADGWWYSIVEFELNEE